jgi:hypothetical protein
MTDFVIDANVLMSILISGKAGYRPILTFNNFILPDFALIEVEKYGRQSSGDLTDAEVEVTKPMKRLKFQCH